jgi:hypothetical protein
VFEQAAGFPGIRGDQQLEVIAKRAAGRRVALMVERSGREG